MIKNSYLCKILQVCTSSICAFTITLASASASENMDTSRTFNINEKSLSKALLEFADQSQLLVVVPPDLVAGKEAPVINGDMTPATALATLLGGSSLVYDVADNSVVVKQDSVTGTVSGRVGL